MHTKMESAFDEWIYKVCEHAQTKYRKNITEIYSYIDLTDAKLAFIDGIMPNEYEL